MCQANTYGNDHFKKLISCIVFHFFVKFCQIFKLKCPDRFSRFQNILKAILDLLRFLTVNKGLFLAEKILYFVIGQVYVVSDVHQFQTSWIVEDNFVRFSSFNFNQVISDKIIGFRDFMIEIVLYDLNWKWVLLSNVSYLDESVIFVLENSPKETNSLVNRWGK